MQDQPLVSVIICAYNAQAFLKHAIECVLSQDYPTVELLVVNDGSNDGTAGIAQSFDRVRYLSHESNLGTPTARNTGIAAAAGEWVIFLDADDLWPDDRISKQIEFQRAHPEHRFSFTRERFFADESAGLPAWAQKPAFREDHVAYCPGGMIFHRSIFKIVGLFDPNLRNGDTTDWLFRAKDLGFTGGVLDEVLLFRRIHAANLSGKVAAEQASLLKAVRDSIGRKRSSQAAPLVSAVIPVYNGDKYIGEAIDSVLAQDYRPLEVLIIDDGSTDATRQVAEKYLPTGILHYHYHAHRGLAYSRNVGMSLASAEFIAYLDADDLWEREKLTLQMQLMQTQPAVEIVAGLAKQFFSPELSEEARRAVRMLEGEVPSYLPSSLLIRKSVFARSGFFDPQYEIGQDMDWFLRAQESGAKIALVDRVVHLRRIHELNHGRIHAQDNYATRLKILKHAIDRRRAASSRPEKS